MGIGIVLGVAACGAAPAAGYYTGKAARRFYDEFIKSFSEGEPEPAQDISPIVKDNGPWLLPAPANLSGQFARVAAAATIAVMIAVPQSEIITRSVHQVAALICYQAMLIDSSRSFDPESYKTYAYKLKVMAAQDNAEV